MSKVRKETSRNTENENKRCKIFNKLLNVNWDYVRVKKKQKKNKNKQTKRKHNFKCSKFNKLYNYNINILHNKTTGL
jgi:hypothetical protein